MTTIASHWNILAGSFLDDGPAGSLASHVFIHIYNCRRFQGQHSKVSAAFIFLFCSFSLSRSAKWGHRLQTRSIFNCAATLRSDEHGGLTAVAGKD